MRGPGKHTPFAALLVGVALLVVSGAQAYTGGFPKMQVRMEWPAPAQLMTLRGIPDLDPMKVVPGEEIILVSNAEQIERLETLGFRIEVLIPTVASWSKTSYLWCDGRGAHLDD